MKKKLKALRFLNIKKNTRSTRRCYLYTDVAKGFQNQDTRTRLKILVKLDFGSEIEIIKRDRTRELKDKDKITHPCDATIGMSPSATCTKDNQKKN